MKEWILKITLVILAFQASACEMNISSSEVNISNNVDIGFYAIIQEYDNQDDAVVTANFQRLIDEFNVIFDQGEYFEVRVAGESTVLFEDGYLSLLDYDYLYEGSIEKAEDDENYEIAYVDENGDETNFTVPTHTSAALITPRDDSHVDGENIEITWNPDDMPEEGNIQIRVRWDGAGASGGVHITDVENTGSYIIAGRSDIRGYGSIRLIHEKEYTDFDEFGETSIKVQSISKVSVDYD